MKLKLMMSTQTSGRIKIDSITATTLKTVHFYDNTNKKVIGKFKDECQSIPVAEFIGLRSKMYSYIKDNNQNNKTAKGIKRISSKRTSLMKIIKRTV